MRLENEAPETGGFVHVVLGNHEVMNLTGDRRYVSAGRLRGIRRTERRARTPPPSRNASARFAPTVDMARGCCRSQSLIVIDDTAYVHGGLASAFAAFGLERGNADFHDALMQALLAGDADAETLLSDDGPVWYRGTALCHVLIEGDALAAAASSDCRYDAWSSATHRPHSPRVVPLRRQRGDARHRHAHAGVPRHGRARSSSATAATASSSVGDTRCRRRHARPRRLLRRMDRQRSARSAARIRADFGRDAGRSRRVRRARRDAGGCRRHRSPRVSCRCRNRRCNTRWPRTGSIACWDSEWSRHRSRARSTASRGCSRPTARAGSPSANGSRKAWRTRTRARSAATTTWCGHSMR